MRAQELLGVGAFSNGRGGKPLAGIEQLFCCMPFATPAVALRWPRWARSCAQVLSRKRDGAVLGPGQCEFSLVKDSEAALTTGQWWVRQLRIAWPAEAAVGCAITGDRQWQHSPSNSGVGRPRIQPLRWSTTSASSLLQGFQRALLVLSVAGKVSTSPASPACPPCRVLPGADGAFVGAQDDMAVVLSNSGRFVSVYETNKLTSAAAKPLYAAELKEGLVAAVYPGGHRGKPLGEKGKVWAMCARNRVFGECRLHSV